MNGLGVGELHTQTDQKPPVLDLLSDLDWEYRQRIAEACAVLMEVLQHDTFKKNAILAILAESERIQTHNIYGRDSPLSHEKYLVEWGRLKGVQQVRNLLTDQRRLADTRKEMLGLADPSEMGVEDNG